MAQIGATLLILGIIVGVAALIVMNIGRALPSRAAVPVASPTVPVLPTAAVRVAVSPTALPSSTPTPDPTSATPAPTAPSTASGTAHVANTGGSGIYLRTDAGANARVLTTLPEGTAVQVTGQTQTVAGTQWVQVQTSDGLMGWISSDFLDTSY